MRITPILAAIAAALFAAPVAAQDPIAESVELLANYDSDGAKEVLDAACKGGSSEACWRLALVMAQDYSDEAKAATDKQFLANCAKGDARSCYMIQRRIPYDADAKANARGQTALRKACVGGLGYACADLADAIQYQSNEGNGPNDAQKKDIAELYVKACELGSRRACHAAAGTYGDGFENPLVDYAKAVALETKACDMGDADACADLPRFELSEMGAEAKPSADQLRRWQELRKRACDLGGSSECESWLNEQVNAP